MFQRIGWIVPLIVVLGWAVLVLRSCRVDTLPENAVWQTHLPELGACTSPRLADLTADGIPDVVFGAGFSNLPVMDSAVVALDGATGEVLWKAGAAAPITGAAAFADISGDGIPEVFIGGWAAELTALDGATGRPVWRYRTQDSVVNAFGYARFRFYDPQFVPDQNGDETPDLLLSNGGNPAAQPYSMQSRYPGVLLVVDSRTGKAIAAATLPDRRETYMTPLIHDFQGEGELSIIIGTGDATTGGSLWRTTLADVLRGDLSGARRLLADESRGFFAPAALADLSGDGIQDIIAAGFNGRLYAIDGRTDSLLWTYEVPGAAIYGGPAVGQFTGDATPDVFVAFARGPWPAHTAALQMVIDGATGRPAFQESVGCYGLNRPLAVNVDDDPYDEILLPVNAFDCERPNLKKVVHYLALFDFPAKELQELSVPAFAKDPLSTPWAGDLDGDGRLDLVYCLLNNGTDYFQSHGVRVIRLETGLPFAAQPAEGSLPGGHTRRGRTTSGR